MEEWIFSLLDRSDSQHTKVVQLTTQHRIVDDGEEEKDDETQTFQTVTIESQTNLSLKEQTSEHQNDNKNDKGEMFASLLDENDNTVRLIDLIRQETGNNSQNRADLRFSIGTDGRVFILNKHDGVIRTLAAVPEPETWATGLIGALALGFCLWRARRVKLARDPA